MGLQWQEVLPAAPVICCPFCSGWEQPLVRTCQSGCLGRSVGRQRHTVVLSATLSSHSGLTPSHSSATSHGPYFRRQCCAQHAAHMSMGLSKHQRDPAAAQNLIGQLRCAGGQLRRPNMALQACEVTALNSCSLPHSTMLCWLPLQMHGRYTADHHTGRKVEILSAQYLFSALPCARA